MAKILVVEDTPENLELMAYLLRAAGHVVSSARDGETGLAAVRANRPDLILCDINMPRMDGYQFVAALQAEFAEAAPRVVAVTALAMVGDRESALAAGFDGYLSKPLDPETFARDITAMLQG